MKELKKILYIQWNKHEKSVVKIAKKDAIWHPDINPAYPIQAVFLECFL